MENRLKTCIDNLKDLPGVYLMHDINDVIIYIGKAKNLKKRVSQYFYRPQVGKVLKMRDSVAYFETIITNNEKEALVLEMNLIQKYYPKYNILLMDDKHYPYIAIKKDDPCLSIKRNKKSGKYEYFGPYPSSSSAYEIINLLDKIYPTRKCKSLPSSPCLYYHLGQCLGQCINKISEEQTREMIDNIKRFLRGDNEDVIKEYEEKMMRASESMDYESALEYKKIIDAIKHINTKQNVEVMDKKDRDIFAYATKENYISLAILNYKRGLLLGKKVFTLEAFGSEEEQISDLILQYYNDHELPQEIIINNETIIEELKPYIDVKITSISRGKLYDLVVSAKENAVNALDEYFLSARIDSDKLALLEELGSILNIETPFHIELFDNSHLQGSSPVGAMVAFINGEPVKKLYRKFLINHEESRDDLASMREIVSRHYSRLKLEGKKMPDLILADGGLPQVKAVIEALNDIKVEGINVFGLYKNNKHQTEGLIDVDGNTYPIENKSLFFLLTRMQDEVHRFAISFHRNKRLKSQTKSILDDIEGLGMKRRETLMKAYPDIHLLEMASLEDLSQILPHDVALRVYQKLHPENF